MLESVIDFETRSVVSLKEAGPWVYSQHPRTQIICLSFEDHWTGEIRRWEPLRKGEEPPQLLYDIAHNPEILLVAHNAIFEQAIWTEIMAKRWGFPDLGPERFVDTMALCGHRGLPLALEKVGKAIKLETLKDMAGNAELNKASQPRKIYKREYKKLIEAGEDPDKPRFHEDDETLRRIGEYCDQDVRVERELRDALGELPEDEYAVWVADQEINRTGMKVDLGAVRCARALIEQERARLLGELRELTGGEITTADQRDRIVHFIYRHQGVAPPTLDKDEVGKWLEREDLHPSVRRLLELRSILGKSSTAKLDKMLSAACDDARARCLLQYQGAQTTGRWAGRLIQPQNIPGGHDWASPEELIWAIKYTDAEYIRLVYGDVFNTVSKALRPMFVAADGYEYVAGDFAAIEARVVLALAGQFDKVKLLADGHDVYADMAETIFDHPAGTVTKDTHPKQRQVGKNAVLGLGFQCGAATFQVKFQDDREIEFCQEVVRTYRQDWAPKVPELWRGLNAACATAVYRRRPAEFAGIRYELEQRQGREWLTARLPSGRKLYYYKPTYRVDETPWGTEQIVVTYWGQKLGQFVPIDLYGGLLTENAVQAIARDIMANALMNVRALGHQVVLTVHDELVNEVVKGSVTEEEIQAFMCQQPEWVNRHRIPVAVETWKAERFRK